MRQQYIINAFGACCACPAVKVARPPRIYEIVVLRACVNDLSSINSIRSAISAKANIAHFLRSVRARHFDEISQRKRGWQAPAISPIKIAKHATATIEADGEASGVARKKQ